MREYGKVSPSFWIGETGKKFRGDLEAQVVAMYLTTGPHANMSGLYYLAIPVLAHETGIKTEGASKALRRVCEAGFAEYDAENEAVWVKEMARYQVGDRLKAHDKRSVGIAHEVERFRKSELFYYFYERYRVPFGLPDPGKIEAPSKPLRSQEQEQEQEQEHYTDPDLAIGQGDPQRTLALVQDIPPPRFDFDAVYKAYPRKEGKGVGLTRLQKQIKTPAQYSQLLTALENYTRKVTAEQTPLNFVMHFSSWVSKWQDYADGVQIIPRDSRGSAPVSRRFDESPEAARDTMIAGIENYYEK